MEYNRLERKCESEEFDLDFSAEENIEKEHPQLILVDEAFYPRENVSPAPIQTDGEEGDPSEESREDSLSTQPGG